MTSLMKEKLVFSFVVAFSIHHVYGSTTFLKILEGLFAVYSHSFQFSNPII